MPRAILYYRVSSDEQYDSGAGLGAQRHACARYLEFKGLEAGPDFEEDGGVSGSTPIDKRPGLMAAVAALRRGDVLLVAKRDRIARDMMLIRTLEAGLRAKGCRLVSAAGEGTDSASHRDPGAHLNRGIHDLFAENELLRIQTRTSDALNDKRRQGERNGRTPYGWDLFDDGRRSEVHIDKLTGASRGGLPIALRPNPDEQRVLRAMDAWRRRGASLAQILYRLNEAGIVTKAGKPWTRSSIAYVLKVTIPLLPPETHFDDEAGESTAAEHAVGPAAVGDPGLGRE